MGAGRALFPDALAREPKVGGVSVGWSVYVTMVGVMGVGGLLTVKGMV